MKRQSLTKGFAVLSAAGIITKILSVLYIPFLLAIIGEEGNGIYAAAYQVYVFIYVIANSGIPVAISKSVSELAAVGNYKDAVRTFRIARFFLIIIGLGLSIIMFVLAKPLAHMINADKSALAIAALSPTLLFTALASAYKGYFQGMSNMTPTAISQVVEQIFHVIFSITFSALLIKVSLEASCAGATVGTSLGALFSAIVLIIMYNRKEKANELIWYKSTARRYSYKQLAQKVIYYSIPITICVGAQYAGNLIDVANIRGRLLTAGYTIEMVSVMHSYLLKYQQIMNAPISIVSALAAAVLPSISTAVAEGNLKLMEDRTRQAFRLCLIIVIPSAAGLSVLSQPVYSMLKYGEGAYLMSYGSVVLILMSIVQIQSSILQGAGKMYMATINVIAGIIVKIILNYLLISNPQINIMGAVISSIAGFGLSAVLNTITIKRQAGIKTALISQSLKPAVSSAVMGIAVGLLYKGVYWIFGFIGSSYVVNAIAVIISVFAGMIIYFFMMIWAHGITKNDLDTLPSCIKKVIPRQVLSQVR